MKFVVAVCILCSLIAVNEAAIAMARFNNPSECFQLKKGISRKFEFENSEIKLKNG